MIPLLPAFTHTHFQILFNFFALHNPMESSDKSINRELPLFPSTPHTSSSFPAILVEERSIPQQQQQRQQQFTIFYDGRICVSDVTELRARAIIMAASREMEERKRTPPAADAMQSQLCGASGVSMKRSLHRFLEKRNNRMAAMAPYRPHRYNNC